MSNMPTSSLRRPRFFFSLQHHPPVHTYPNKHRTVLTASFTETSLVKLSLDIFVLAGTSHLFDGLLDPPRLALFIFVVAVGSAVLTSVSIFLGFVATRWESIFFTPTYGSAGVLCGLFVLAKQRIPTEAVLPGGMLPAFRVQSLPFAWVCATAATRFLVGGVEGGLGMVSDLPLAFWALFVSWCVRRPWAFVSHWSTHGLLESRGVSLAGWSVGWLIVSPILPRPPP